MSTSPGKHKEINRIYSIVYAYIPWGMKKKTYHYFIGQIVISTNRKIRPLLNFDLNL